MYASSDRAANAGGSREGTETAEQALAGIENYLSETNVERALSEAVRQLLNQVSST